MRPEQRTLLRGYLARVGRVRAAQALGIGIPLLERAIDPFELLPEDTIRRIVLALTSVSSE